MRALNYDDPRDLAEAIVTDLADLIWLARGKVPLRLRRRAERKRESE